MRQRIVFVFFVVVVLFVGLLLRGGYLQLVPNERLSKLQTRQFQSELTIKGRRGSLLDRNGNELAVSVAAYSLFADPSIIKDISKVSAAISKYLPLTAKSIEKKIKKGSRRFVWIKRKLPESTMESIQKLGIRGLGFIEESRRIYPNKHLASQLLGVVGADDQGREGLEFQFNKHLAGRDQKVFVKRDARGRPLLVGDALLSAPLDGKDIHLTLDQELQYMLEYELKQTVIEYEAKGAVGVILDARNSEVLAMANIPTFDANQPFKYPAAYRKNRVVTDAFEPGSTFKPFVVAAAMQADVVKANTKVNCEGGQFKIGRRIIREADTHHKFENLTVSEVLSLSSNVGSSKVALQLGDMAYKSFLERLFIGRRTDFDFPGVTPGILRPTPWGDHQLATVSFGHGVTASPLQIAAGYAAFANGGYYIPPVIQKGMPVEERRRKILKESVAHQVKMMLAAATAEGSTGFAARVAGYPVAGKTGTAQKVDFVNGGYAKGQYIASFAGFVPVHQPRFVIYVAIDAPQKNYYGSQVAAPVFSKVAGYAVRKAGLSPILIDDTNVLTQSEQSTNINRSPAVESQLIGAELGRVPKLKGLSLRQAMGVLKNHKKSLKVEVSGRGTVVDSVPGWGGDFPDRQPLRIILKE